MITALDTNILLDVLLKDSVHTADSEAAINRAADIGVMVISEAVFAELASRFDSEAALSLYLREMTITLAPSGRRALVEAGRAFAQHTRRRPDGLQCAQCGNRQQLSCSACGSAFRGRQHVLADFLIGAHAIHHADRLLTRDRGFYATNFPDLALA